MSGAALTSMINERPPEGEALFNPAFTAVTLAHAANGYTRRAPHAMPLSLAFLVAPMVLHGATRQALPRAVTTKLSAWLDGRPLIRAGMAPRARALAPAVRAGIRTGLRAGILNLEEDALRGAPPRRRRGLDLTDEVIEIFDKARFSGGWLALSGPPSAVYAFWRVKP